MTDASSSSSNLKPIWFSFTFQICTNCSDRNITWHECKKDRKKACGPCEKAGSGHTCQPTKWMSLLDTLQKEVIPTIWPKDFVKDIRTIIQKGLEYLVLDGLAVAALFRANRSRNENYDMARELHTKAKKSAMIATEGFSAIGNDRAIHQQLFVWWTLSTIADIELSHYAEDDLFLPTLSMALKAKHARHDALRIACSSIFNEAEGDGPSMRDLLVQRSNPILSTSTDDELNQYRPRINIRALIENLGQAQLGPHHQLIQVDLFEMADDTATLFRRIAFEATRKRNGEQDESTRDNRLLLHHLGRLRPHQQTWLALNMPGYQADIWLVFLAQWAILLNIRTNGDNAEEGVWWMKGLAIRIKTRINEVFQNHGLLQQKVWSDTLLWLDTIK